MTVLVVSHCLAKDKMTRSSGKREEEKLKNSRKALGMMRGLTGNDLTHVYNRFWGLVHNEYIGQC